MPRTGGVYSLPAGNPVVSGTTIEASWANTTMNDVATALTDSIARDGTTAITANLPMAGFRHTGVGTASARNHYGVVSQVQDGAYTLAGSVAGTDTVTASLTPAITAYADGMRARLFPANTNTGAVTLALNGLTARSIVKFNGIALVAGDLVQGVPADVVYDLTNTRWVLQNPQAGAVPANSVTNAMLRQSVAVSVIGRSANSTGDVADIAAGANDRVLRRVSNALDFGQLTAGMFPNTVVPDAALSAKLSAIAGLAVTDGNFIVGNGSTFVAESGATARASLGLGSAAVEADTKYAHRANNLSDLASAATARSNLGVAIGSNVQAWDANLDQIAALAVTDGNVIVGNGTAWVAESGATARASLGVAIGSNVQAWDANLDQIAALAVTDGNIIVGNGTAWVAESGATARTSLGLGTGDSPQFTAINVGHASDTTVSRVAAGQIGVEGDAIFSHASGTYVSAKITFQNGGSPSGGSDGDIVLIY